MEYVLMREEREVLWFDVDLPSGAVRKVRPLQDASWAPLGVLDHPERPEAGLSRFIRDRSISPLRADLPDILRATGAHSPLELAFRAGGFSLSDPYWYRAPGSSLSWGRQNFFDNGWDPSFGNAVLRRDFDALGRATPATPDVTCSGASRKAWTQDAAGPRLLKAPAVEGSACVAGEVLTSRLLAHLLPKDEFVAYEPVERDGETYAACRPMVRPGEEYASAWQVLSAARDSAEEAEPAAGSLGGALLARFASALSHLGVEGAGQAVPKVMLPAQLVFNRDMHPRNLGVIRAASGELRLAPLFDYDRAFGLAQRDALERICARPHVAALIAACTFSDLDPSWDYSWYDPQALDGFEGEVERAFRACEDVPQDFAELAARLFASQRAYVNRVASAGC